MCLIIYIYLAHYWLGICFFCTVLTDTEGKSWKQPWKSSVKRGRESMVDIMIFWNIIQERREFKSRSRTSEAYICFSIFLCYSAFSYNPTITMTFKNMHILFQVVLVFFSDKWELQLWLGTKFVCLFLYRHPFLKYLVLSSPHTIEQMTTQFLNVSKNNITKFLIMPKAMYQMSQPL